ncbi:MAG: ATP-binding cassette domain-containing protein [Eubacteriales bacterium]|nr:ATP-binding cassette domain-containing protein [Eubacteriales bacterium]
MSLLVDIEKDYGDFCLSCHLQSEKGVLGLLGASGSGKTMILKCIAGIVTPDRGKIILNGRTLFDSEQKVNLPPQKRKVGYLFQNYGLFPNMTLEKNILCGIQWEKDKNKRAVRAQEMIHKMELTGLEKRKPDELSGGQQQRTALARILVGQPEILLLDEPFSALDAFLRDRLVANLKHTLVEYGKDVILVTHSRDEIYRLCQETALISEGKILNQGKVNEIFASPGSIRGANLTGCKNISKAVKTGEKEVHVPGWNMTFQTENPVGEHLAAIGIRAHYFDPELEENSGEVEFLEEIEEPFEWILKFRYVHGKESEPDLWWRLPKDRRSEQFPKKLGIAPQNIMLLYED